MALTNDLTMQVNVTLMDRDRNKSNMSFNIANGGLLAVIELAITGTLLTAIEAITDAVVVAWSVTTGGHDRTPALPPESSDVERKGVFSFRAANGSSYVVSVPSIKNTMVIDETQIINKADSAIAAFITTVLDGTILGIAHPVTYLNSDIVSLEKAVKKHRGSPLG